MHILDMSWKKDPSIVYLGTHNCFLLNGKPEISKNVSGPVKTV